MTAPQRLHVRHVAIRARRDELLTVKEFAAMARLDAQTIYRRIWRQQQPGAVRVGGRWRIDAATAMDS